MRMIMQSVRALVTPRSRALTNDAISPAPSWTDEVERLLAPIPAAVLAPLIAGKRSGDRLLADVVAAASDMTS